MEDITEDGEDDVVSDNMKSTEEKLRLINAARCTNGVFNEILDDGYSCDSLEDIVSVSPKLKKIISDNALVKIATSEARNRNFLVGCSNSWGSLLGEGQLTSHFPDHLLKLFVGTFNTNESAAVPCDLSDFLLPENSENIPDIYAIGTQENTYNRFDWEVCLQETIGLSHVLLHSIILGTLHLAIFIRRELIWFCSGYYYFSCTGWTKYKRHTSVVIEHSYKLEPEEGTLLTRQGSMIKTKGAVAVALQVFGTSFLFINSHLTAHEGNIKERISDYEKITNGIDLPKKTPIRGDNGTDFTSKFDCVFWFGDLNFRLSCDRHKVLDCLCKPCPALCDLLSTDQLKRVILQGTAFKGFLEDTIAFSPSYKYDVGTDAYDSSDKQRTPAYTDRILYRMRKENFIKCLKYSSVPSIKFSDHKPVYSIFKVHLRPGRDNIPLSAGLFNRNVYLKVVAHRASALSPRLHLKNSKFCSVM